MIYLKTFKLSNYKTSNTNIYPYNVLKNKEPDILVFAPITVLYGNNGSGKSTVLNIMAHKLNLKGKERSNPKVVGTCDYFEDFASQCEYELGENENSRKITRLPEHSRYIKSEEILYEIRKIQQDAILQESIESNLARERGLQNAKEFLETKEGQKQFARFQFARRQIFQWGNYIADFRRKYFTRYVIFARRTRGFIISTESSKIGRTNQSNGALFRCTICDSNPFAFYARNFRSKNL